MWPVSINCNVLFLCCVYMLCAHSLKPTGLFSACSERQNILLLFFLSISVSGHGTICLPEHIQTVCF